MASKEPVKGQVKLRNVRLSFAQLFRAKAVGSDPNSTPKHSASFLIPKEKVRNSDPNLKAIREAIAEMMQDKWGKNQPKIKADKMCLRDGDEESWDGYPGHLYISASNSRKPRTLDRQKNEVTEADGILYSGCYVDAIVRIWCQDHKEYGKRVNASLEGVQYRGPGEAFGAAPLDDDEFDEIDGDDDETGLGDDRENDGDDGGVL